MIIVNSNNSNNNDKNEILQLPPSQPDNEDIPSIQLGESVKFDHLGPIILNTDGTTRQIANWDKLSKREQEVTWRRIKKRNEERRKQLLSEREKEQNDN